MDAEDPIPSRYTLEVSSPGLERPLRRPEHYQRAIGSRISVKRRPGDGERRIEGQLLAVDDERITLESGAGEHQEIQLDTVERARTVFDWGTSPNGRNGAGQQRGAAPGGGRSR